MAGLLGPRIGAGSSGDFLRWANALYATRAAMARSAAVAKAGVPREKFVWGEYQKRVCAKDEWPRFTREGKVIDTHEVWDDDVRQVRASLQKQQNKQPVTPNDPGNVPANRCDLLDEAVRIAFYSDPPIPKTVDAGRTDGPEHELELGWSQDADGRLVRLHVTVLCPPAPKAGASGP